MDVSDVVNKSGKIRQWRRQLVPNNNSSDGSGACGNSTSNILRDKTGRANVTALACHPHGDVIISALGGGTGELVPINGRFGLNI